MTDATSLDPLADEIDVEVVVQGARGAFERDELIDVLGDRSAEHDVALQAFAPEGVYGGEHLAAAARRAVRSHREDRAIARNLSVEVACYAAGTDQIEDALAALGVPAEGDELVLLGVGDDAREAVDEALDELGLTGDADVVGRPESALDTLGVPTGHRERLDEEDWDQLVVEQVALLDARR